ncbi:MAG: minD [Friedmanniella sp.]|nr:minD [Friedmanniella sp.]
MFRGSLRESPAHTPDMEQQRSSPRSVVVVTADADLLEDVLSVTAAVGLEPEVHPDVSGLRRRWSTVSAVLVGADQAERVAGLRLPRRGDVVVVGRESEHDALHRWSLELGASVAAFPTGANWLSGALAAPGSRGRGPGTILGVLGGSGGVGASTVVAALGVVAARDHRSVLLVEADPYGGGLDLLLGAERLPGWRWPRLAGARGHLGDLRGQLPHVEGCDLLAMARGAGVGGRDPGPEPLEAVLGSAAQSHDLVLVDLPRASTPASGAALGMADLLVLVVRANVGGAAAARELVADLEVGCPVGLLVRTDRVRSLTPDAVAEGLDLPLWGVCPDDRMVPLAAERGDPPGRSTRSPLAGACRALLDHLPARGRAA